MSKLLRFKEWVTVPEAAKRLSTVFEEEVAEADVLRLALDGHLKLSVNLINHCEAKGGRVVSICEARKAQSLDDPERFVVLGIPLSAEKIFELHEGIISLQGVWDLPMIGGEKLDIENRYQLLTGGVQVTLMDINGVFLGSQDNGLFQVQADWADSGSRTDLAEGKSWHDPERYYPDCKLPYDSVLVVRTDALREFEQSIKDVEKITEKPIASNERNSLLTIIAALCDYSAIKYQERGAASQIAKLTEELGAPVSDDSVRRALEKIPSALEARMK